MNTATQSTAREVRISAGDAWLYGDLVTPPGFAGLVLFAHGSGSGRHSARNRQVAQRLQQAGIATLLFDLLTVQEEQVDLQTREHRFDIPLLTRRMQDATEWAWSQPELHHAPIGYFGASTGSAAAIIAAARLGDRIKAVVSQGRPSRSGGPGRAGRGQGPDAADRWRGGPRRDRTQSGGLATPAMREGAHRHSWRDPPVRGARRAR